MRLEGIRSVIFSRSMRPRKTVIVPPNCAADGQWHERHSNRMLETTQTFEEDLVPARRGAGT
jgi:hypothetical protein